MGNLLSAISGQFAKAILLGTFFPVVILTALNILLVAPLLPQTASVPGLLAKIAVGDEKWSAVVLTFIVILITGLLYNLNIPIIRIYEGYPWADSLVGNGLTRLQKRRLARATNLRSSAETLGEQLSAADADLQVLSDLDARHTDMSQFLSSQLPDSEDLLLPTRLGNVIRCFERYPKLTYGIDAIAVWPRLVAKIESSFASTIDETKTSFDFMLNTSFLSAVTTCIILTIGLGQRMPLSLHAFFPVLWRASVFAALGIVFYWLAINRALAWGLQVRAAFDLYRFDLLKQMGYSRVPRTNSEEKALWSTISMQLLYSRVSTSYEGPPTRIIAFPSDVEVSVRRKYGIQEPNLRIPVTVVVANLDSTRAVSTVSIVDLIPDGYRFVPGSASALATPNNAALLNVTRMNPLEFLVGQIPASGKVTIQYAIRPTT